MTLDGEREGGRDSREDGKGDTDLTIIHLEWNLREKTTTNSCSVKKYDWVIQWFFTETARSLGAFTWRILVYFLNDIATTRLKSLTDATTWYCYSLIPINARMCHSYWHHFCQGTFILAFWSCGILRRINTAVFGARKMIFAKELCHIRPSNRPLTSCLSESYLAGYLCEWMAAWPVHLKSASQTDWKCCKLRTMIVIWQCYQPMRCWAQIRHICKCTATILHFRTSDLPSRNYWCKMHNIQGISWHKITSNLATVGSVCNHC